MAVAGGMALGFTPLVSGPAASGIEPLPYAPELAHEAYGYFLAERRLMGASPGREWVAAADRAVLAAQGATLPFEAETAFVAQQPRAFGYVGNTGNAVTTPTHLHVGVYVRRAGMRGGAKDPVGFLR